MLRVGVMGAGAIGCYLGGRLAAGGIDVAFVGRGRAKRELETHGLTLTDLDGKISNVPKENIAFATEPRALADRDIVLVCVKSLQTEEAGVELAKVLSVGAVVVSMQNGVRNQEVLRAAMKQQIVLGGIVGFNVLSRDRGSFRRATSGPLAIEASEDSRVRALALALSACGFEIRLARDIQSLQWSKLMMNLNNAVSALTNAPTRDLVFVKEYRRILAAIVEESLGVLGKAGIRPARFGPLPVGLFPHLLRLPTPILRVVARAQLRIDPEARSSMWEDLSKGRLTEVDYLNGEIVRVAESCGAKAPLNRRIVELVHEVEAKGQGSPKLSADALWNALRLQPG